MYSGYGIVCDDVGSWNLIIFGADNSSSFHADNRQNNFLVLGEGPT